ncbi:hypothetical protein FOMPIDRAFT_1060403 [Fomitopsis schrenkii]|uniref:Fungal-type protein kinase domain-containing protein n=1 Tax=Fomitopsis schrenkii TaxID=2126942 RepID=S8EAZ6_FOMSC|nr:hypothetical protein FOMPIDRAFT_1060403 [Fomitopsis schrenkii]
MLTGRRMTVYEEGIVSQDRRALVAPAGVVALKDPEEVSADDFRTHSRSSANPGFEELLVDPELQGKRILENKLGPSTYLADLWSVRSIDKCISRRHRLWRGNIDCSVDHTDLSVGSFELELVPLDIKLRDFDLSCVVGTGAPGGPQGTQRTGSIAFMALDLLTSEYWEGKVERLYRHDLEGSWRLQDWFTSDHNRCREEKRDFLSKWTPIDRKDATKDVFDYAIALLLWLMDKQTTRDKRVLYARATRQPERGEDQDAPAAYQEIQKIVEDFKCRRRMRETYRTAADNRRPERVEDETTRTMLESPD